MIKKINLYQFRNFKDITTLKTLSRCIVFTGLNGSGKTSLLEAIYITCVGSSFKEHKDEILCNYGQNKFSLSCYHKIDDYQDEKIIVSYSNGLKQIKIDGEPIKERKELLKRYPCFVFSYEDIELVSNSQENRRRFFDQLISFVDLEYVETLRNFKKTLKERNIILKAINDAHNNLLSNYTKKIIELGQKIENKREYYLKLFGKELIPLLKTIFLKPITIELVKSWQGFNNIEIESFIISKLESEIKRGTSLFGPHRDCFLFKDGLIDIAPYWSIGQKRTLTLLLKIAASNFICKNHKRKPILLIDDVLLELDYKQQEKILALLTGYEQLFFTFLPKQSLLKGVEDVLVFNLVDGKINENKE